MTDAITAMETIEQVVRIDADPETVWTFWTDPDRLCEWFGVEATTVAEVGGVFRVVMQEGPIALGEYLELAPPHRLVVSFGWEGGAPGGAMPPGSSRVEITLVPDGDATVLTLVHHLPSVHAVDHRKGWAYFVGDRMAALAKESRP